MRYLETKSTDPAYNLAYEEWVLTHLCDGEYLILWQNENTVVIGQNQNTPEEINADFIREHGVRVVRRTTGGGAVYHDLGNLNYSFITDYDRDAGMDMSRFTGLVINALRGMGLKAEASGRNDILVEGKKVSGTAQRIVKVKKGDVSIERILYHGTLLFRSDPKMIAGALHADPLKFTSKSTKSVRSRVGNIADYLPGTITLTDFRDRLKHSLSSSEDAEAEIPCIDGEAILRLKQEKYDTYEWNYGRSPKCGFKNRRRFAGGTLEADLEIEKGRILDAALFGDFLSLKPASEIAAALIGAEFKDEAVDAVLSGFVIPDYLGTITKEEALETIMGSGNRQ